METLACGHTAVIAGHWCAHLLEDMDASYHVRFTGRGADHDLLCEACARTSMPAPTRLTVCGDCQSARLRQILDLLGISGQPQVRIRATALRFEHREHTLPALARTSLRALAPLESQPRSSWLSVDAKGTLLRIDLDDGAVIPLGSVATEDLQLHEALTLHGSPCGRFAALANTRGSKGVVVDLSSGAVTLRLDRGGYHEKHCMFPVAFFLEGTQSLLVHASDWNRLDLSDPATGHLLTQREMPGRWKTGEPMPAHHLDYFHCGLTVSPTGEWLVDDGWVWHPVGILKSWSLRRWATENVWESEDGASMKQLRECAYHWDGPRCFVGERTLAVWGFGGDDESMVDAALLFDVESGKLLRWFPGPRGEFRCDGGLLLTSAKAEGTSVWDLETGERLHQDPGLVPSAWHSTARRFLTLRPDGVLRESVLRGDVGQSGG